MAVLRRLRCGVRSGEAWRGSLTRAKRPAVAAAALWALAYVIVWTSGQRFSTAYLDYGWQMLPYDTLRADPLGGVWYLHIQPPLWNLTIGCIGRWSPFPTAISLQLLMFVFGLVLVGLLTSLLGRLRLRPRAAVIVSLVATLNPTVIKMAFEPQYELAVACGLVALVWAIAGRAEAANAKRYTQAALIGTAIVMTRSLYPPEWLVVLLAGLAWVYRGSLQWRRVIGALAVPVIAIGGWMLKNEILFGTATMSSWSGMNFERAVLPVVPQAELRRLVDAGKISEVALIGPFQAYDEYRPYVASCTPSHHHPAVDTPLRTRPVTSIFDGATSYVANFNYECYLPIYDRAGADAWYVTLHYPRAWLEGRLWSARAWFGAGLAQGASSSAPLRWLDDLYGVARVDVALPQVSMRGWGTTAAFEPIARARTSIALVVLTAVVIAVGLGHSWRIIRRRGSDLARSGALSAVGLVAGWSFAVGIVGELGEQARFRTMTDPLVVAVGLASIVRWFGDRRDRAA